MIQTKRMNVKNVNNLSKIVPEKQKKIQVKVYVTIKLYQSP